MKVNCLSCKVCAQEYEVGPKYVCEMCFGPLEEIGRAKITLEIHRFTSIRI